MAERLEILLPRSIYERIKRKAEQKKMRLQDLVLRAIMKVLEED